MSSPSRFMVMSTLVPLVVAAALMSGSADSAATSPIMANDGSSVYFSIMDLIDELPGINSTINSELPELDIPGNPLDSEDFRIASDHSIDDVTLDEAAIQRDGDPILKAKAFEGDIVNVDVEELAALYELASNKNRAENDDGQPFRNAIKESYHRWPNGVVPYLISSVYSSYERSVIARAMQEYHQKTCIRFVPRTSENDYIHIVKGQGCSSSVGRTRSVQTVSLGEGCVYMGIVIHELMHAVGFWHEQSRADRDSHVQINYQNIMRGMEYNFLKYSLDKIDHLGATYDTCSVMHYGAYAFSSNNQKTIQRIGQGSCELGQRSGFSDTDLKKINTLYRCSEFSQIGAGVPTTTKKPEVTDKPDMTCRDTHEYCADWANSGECQKNPAWMLKECPVACKECKNKCSDHNEDCAAWTASGECSKNAPFMDIYCAKSCGKCSSSGCTDEHKDCTFWSKQGHCCSSYSAYMKLRCKKSCNFCSP